MSWDKGREVIDQLLAAGHLDPATANPDEATTSWTEPEPTLALQRARPSKIQRSRTTLSTPRRGKR